MQDADLAEHLLNQAADNIDLQFAAMRLMEAPDDPEAIRQAKDLLRPLGNFRFQEDLEMEQAQAAADEKETELERMAWNKITKQISRVGVDKACNQRGIKFTDIRMGDWSQRFATRHHGPRARRPVPSSFDMADICSQCGSDNMTPDYERSEMTCMHCFTVSGMMSRDIGAAVHMQIKKRHMYDSGTHFMTYVRSCMGNTKHDKVPYLADILEELRFCFNDTDARAVLREYGLSRMYSKVPKLMSWAKEEYDVPRFTDDEIELFRLRHQFWAGVFRAMGKSAPRVYFFNTKYVLLRILHEQGLWEKHKHFIDRYVFGVDSTIVSNEINWRRMFNFAKEQGYLKEGAVFQCLPCYRTLVISKLREKRERRETEENHLPKKKKTRYT